MSEHNYLYWMIGGVFLMMTGAIIFSSNVAIFSTGLLSVDNNWTESGTLDNLQLYDGTDYITAAGGEAGNWTSYTQEAARSLPITAQVESTNGGGDMTIYWIGYDDDPREGNATAKVVSRELDGGIDDVVFTGSNVTQSEYFQVALEIVETSGSNNNRPRIDSVDLSYSYQENSIFEPGRQATQALGILVVITGIVFIVMALRG